MVINPTGDLIFKKKLVRKIIFLEYYPFKKTEKFILSFTVLFFFQNITKFKEREKVYDRFCVKF